LYEYLRALSVPVPLLSLKSGSNGLTDGHPWRMSLPVIAIIVSVASALFTATNVTISFASYRRVRPKVVLKVKYAPRKSVLLSETEHPGDTVCGFHVLLESKSQSSVKTRSVVADYRLPFRESWWLKQWAKDGMDPYGLEFDEGEVDTEIPPFGGAQWVLWKNFHRVYFGRKGRKIRVRIQVTLTNGRQVHSRWMKLHILQRKEERSRRPLSAEDRVIHELFMNLPKPIRFLTRRRY